MKSMKLKQNYCRIMKNWGKKKKKNKSDKSNCQCKPGPKKVSNHTY